MNPEKLRPDFPVLERRIGGKPIVYFDNACMALKSRQVIQAMNEYYEQFPACAGRSMHRLSREVEERCQKARKSVAAFLGAKDREIIFTRNTTEGLNLVYHSLGLKKGDAVLTSDREHNSNLIPCQVLAREKGVEHRVAGSHEDGTFDMEDFSQKVKGAKLVSVVHTSNLDGYTLPVKEIIRLSHDEGALVMLDAAQSAPHKDINVRKLGADFLACSGHKLTGPTGTGALYGRYDLLEDMGTFMLGGETVSTSSYTSHKLLKPPEKFEAGLQDYAGIIGFGAAADYVRKAGRESIESHERELNSIITEGIRDIKGLRILGPHDPAQRSGIVSFLLEGMDHHQIALLLDGNANIMIRSGHHCVSSWFTAHSLQGSARASLYLYNTKEEAELFVQGLGKIAELR